MRITFRNLTPEEIEKGKKRCRLVRLICFKIPLWLWLAALLLIFLLGDFNLVGTLVIAVYTGIYLIPWLLIWYFVTNNWRHFL